MTSSRSRRFSSACRLRIAWLGYSPEWTAGIRNHRVAAGILPAALLGCACVPYAGFPALALTALLCASLYGHNEPPALLQLPERGSSRLLWLKIRTAWRNYFLLTAPAAALALALHPDTAWMAAAWIPFAALVFLYAVVAKYAAYTPDARTGTRSGTVLTGYLGFLVPPLLPLTLVLIVVYARRAEKRLNRYLYDYD